MIKWLVPLLLLTGVAQAQQLVSPIEVKDCGSQFVKQISATGLVTCAASTSTGLAPVSWVAATNVDDAIVLIAPTALTVTSIKSRVIAAVGAAATISVVKAASGTACTTAAGVNLIASSGTIDANSASTTVQSATLAGSGAPSLSANDTICLKTTNGSAFTAGSGKGDITIGYTIP